MPVLPLAFVLVATTPASDRHSLGIGLDVLPQAYAVAAARVHAPADLRLQSCTASSCLWRLGDDVAITASVARTGIGIGRLAAQRAVGAETPDALARYRAACLTIITLIEPSSSPSERSETVATIAASANSVEVERPDLGVTFFASRPAGLADQCGVEIGPDEPSIGVP